MTLCGGVCEWRRGGGCRIKLSGPLLKVGPEVVLSRCCLGALCSSVLSAARNACIAFISIGLLAEGSRRHGILLTSGRDGMSAGDGGPAHSLHRNAQSFSCWFAFLQLRPSRDLKMVLLHEMIHADMMLQRESAQLQHR